MKAIQRNELMIGNFLLFKFPSIEDSVIKLTDIANSYVSCTEVAAIDYKRVEPIALTEDWLLKFGMLPSVTDNRYVFPDNEYFDISSDGSLYFENSFTAVYVKYVHQLQNLYFALCQTELKTK